MMWRIAKTPMRRMDAMSNHHARHIDHGDWTMQSPHEIGVLTPMLDTLKREVVFDSKNDHAWTLLSKQQMIDGR